jgi:hypothetical protein
MRHVGSEAMLLEDVSTRSLSSVDFGRAAQDAAANPKGLALPPPTEFINAPVDILDAEAALSAARRERESMLWRIGRQLRRVIELAKDILLKTRNFVPKRSSPDDLPEVEVSKEIDLEPDDEADTARNPTPAPFPAVQRQAPAPPRRNIVEEVKPRRKNSNQWKVTTQVVDMRPRKKSQTGEKEGNEIPIDDLTLDEE